MSVTQAQFESNLQGAFESIGYENVTRGEVKEILGVISDEIGSALKKEGRVSVRGIGIFSTKKKPATKKRKGINPFTKEEQVFAAKPASTQVKVRPAKELKAPFEKKK